MASLRRSQVGSGERSEKFARTTFRKTASPTIASIAASAIFAASWTAISRASPTNCLADEQARRLAGEIRDDRCEALAEGTGDAALASATRRAYDASTLLEATSAKARAPGSPPTANIRSLDGRRRAIRERSARGAQPACRSPTFWDAPASTAASSLVDERVLVPRPESEHLVDEAIAFLRRDREADVLDVGTGSGAIAVQHRSGDRSRDRDATDISAGGVAVASENARTFTARASLRVPPRRSRRTGGRTRRFDVVVANLPYVPSGDIPPAPESGRVRTAPLPSTAAPTAWTCIGGCCRTAPSLEPSRLVLLEAAPADDRRSRGSLRGRALRRRPSSDATRTMRGLARYVRADRRLKRPLGFVRRRSEI